MKDYRSQVVLGEIQGACQEMGCKNISPSSLVPGTANKEHMTILEKDERTQRQLKGLNLPTICGYAYVGGGEGGQTMEF